MQHQPGLRGLGAIVAAITDPLLRGRRLPAVELAVHWTEIAGAEIASASRPEKLMPAPKRRDGGTLRLRVASGAAALQVQHQSDILIERINGFLGWPAVARLHLVQAPIPGQRPQGPSLPGASPDAIAAGLPGAEADGTMNAASIPGVDAIAGLDAIDSEPLRRALANLARQIRRNGSG